MNVSPAFRLRLLRFAFAAVCASPVFLFAQASPATTSRAYAPGALSGTIVTAGNASPIAGARVRVVGGEASATTDGAGAFQLGAIAAGTYALAVEAETFRPARIVDVVVRPAETTALGPLGLALAPAADGTQPVEEYVVRASQLGETHSALSGERPAAAAPKPAEEVVKLEAFVSVGSRFTARTVVDSPVPVDIVGFKELNIGGATELNQMVQATVPSFNFPRPTIAGGSDHIRPATLRGLAPDQVLVLVNGKRRHTSALVNLNDSIGRGSVSVDMNAIPSSAIERIEVLRDGASAQYGSDAIAGVINLVLRKDTKGSFDATWGITGTGDGEVREASVRGGVPLGRKGGTLFGTLFWRERERTNRAGADTRQQYFGINTTTGAPVAYNDNFGAGFAPTTGNGTTVAAGPTTTFRLDPREATVNRDNHRYGDPDIRDRGAALNLTLPLKNDGEFYAFGAFTKRAGDAVGFFRRPGDNSTVRALWPDGFLAQIKSNIQDVSAGGGFKGALAGWHWDAGTVYGRNAFGFRVHDSNNVSLGTASPRHVYAGTLGFAQSTSTLDLDRSFEIGRAHPLKLALGAEFRFEEFTQKAGEQASWADGGARILDGPNAGQPSASAIQVFGGFRPDDAKQQSRTNSAFYADVEHRLHERLLLSAAVRWENYSDFGAELTEKISTRVTLTERLGLRASASTGFRAPHLDQQWYSAQTINFIAGVPFVNYTFPATNPIARELGASALKPETSVNYSAGLTWNQRNFSASLDCYQIDIDDRVVLSSNFTGNAVAAFLAARGYTSATGGRYFTNAVNTRTRGADLSSRYTRKLTDHTRLTVTLAANVNRTTITSFKSTPPQLAAIGVTTPLFDIIERVRMAEGQPRSNVNLGITLDHRAWTFSLRNVRHGEFAGVQTDVIGWSAARIAAVTPGYDVRLVDPVPGSPAGNRVVIQDFAAKWVTDIEVARRFWNRRVLLSAGVNNVFDVYPDRNIRSTPQWQGADMSGILPYHRFSPFGFNGAFYFGKLRVEF